MARVRCRVLLRGFAALLVLLAAPALAQEPSGPGLFERPVLALDPGLHTAPIRRADVDRSGSYAVTGSDDRTVRVWSVADGTLLRTIRLPVGPGDVGKVYAVAISPDGALIAAGGWTRWHRRRPDGADLPVRARQREDAPAHRGAAQCRQSPDLLGRWPPSGGGAGRWCGPSGL